MVAHRVETGQLPISIPNARLDPGPLLVGATSQPEDDNHADPERRTQVLQMP